MQYALYHHRLIQAQMARSGYRYYCLFCHRRVIVHHAQTSYFVHYNKNVSCGGESSEHLKGKLGLASFFTSWTSQVEIEKYIPQIQQWPDVLIDNSIALEFQCSPISTARLLERNRGYHRMGITPWWILGPPYYRRRLGSRYFALFLRYSPKIGFYLSFWLVKSSCFLIRFCYREIGGRTFYRTQRFYHFSELNRFLHHQQLIFKCKDHSLLRDVRTIQKQEYYHDSDVTKLQIRLTPTRYSVDSCPLICHYPRINPPLFKGKCILWHLWILISLDHSQNLKQVYHDANREMNFPLNFPQIMNIQRFYHQSFIMYLRKLINRGYLVILGDRIIKWRPPRWFSSEYDKVLCILHGGK